MKPTELSAGFASSLSLRKQASGNYSERNLRKAIHRILPYVLPGGPETDGRLILEVLEVEVEVDGKRHLHTEVQFPHE